MFPHRISWLRAIGLLLTRIIIGVLLGLATTNLAILWFSVLIGASALMAAYNYTFTKANPLKEGINAFKISLYMEGIILICSWKLSSNSVAQDWIVALSCLLWLSLAPIFYQQELNKELRRTAKKAPQKKPATVKPKPKTSKPK
jgi:hypothetical protein